MFEMNKTIEFGPFRAAMSFMLVPWFRVLSTTGYSDLALPRAVKVVYFFSSNAKTVNR